MKIVSMIAALSVFAGSSVAAATAQPTPFGLWQNPKATIIVRAHSCGELLCGTIIWPLRKRFQTHGTQALQRWLAPICLVIIIQMGVVVGLGKSMCPMRGVDLARRLN